MIFEAHKYYKVDNCYFSTLVEKSGWAWSYTFENQNKRNAFLRFLLKENGSNNINRKFIAEKYIFHEFACIK